MFKSIEILNFENRSGSLILFVLIPLSEFVKTNKQCLHLILFYFTNKYINFHMSISFHLELSDSNITTELNLESMTRLFETGKHNGKIVAAAWIIF